MLNRNTIRVATAVSAIALTTIGVGNANAVDDMVYGTATLSAQDATVTANLDFAAKRYGTEQYPFQCFVELWSAADGSWKAGKTVKNGSPEDTAPAQAQIKATVTVTAPTSGTYDATVKCQVGTDEIFDFNRETFTLTVPGNPSNPSNPGSDIVSQLTDALDSMSAG